MFLLLVGLLPFTTAVFSSTGLTQGVNPILWSFYAFNMIGTGFMLTLTWGYSYTHGLVDPQIGPEPARFMVFRQLVAPTVFLISIGIEFLTPRTYLAQYA